MTATNDRISIPDRSRPGTTTAFPVGHQGGNDKCAAGTGREDITIATWNVRTLRAAGKVEELLHDMDRYKWSILDCVRCDGKNLEKSKQMGVTECISVEKRTNMNKEWVS